MTALLLIDIQKGLQQLGFYGDERNNLDAELNSTRILEAVRKKGWPIFHVQHCSTNPDSPLYPSKETHAFQSGVTPQNEEPVIAKEVNSAFIGTDLEQRLKKQGITDVIISGLTTEHCISTSTRMAANLGFNVTLISDATASFNKTGIDGESISAQAVHQIALANLKDEFARIVDTPTLLKELAI